MRQREVAVPGLLEHSESRQRGCYRGAENFLSTVVVPDAVADAALLKLQRGTRQTETQTGLPNEAQEQELAESHRIRQSHYAAAAAAAVVMAELVASKLASPADMVLLMLSWAPRMARQMIGGRRRAAG